MAESELAVAKRVIQDREAELAVLRGGAAPLAPIGGASPLLGPCSDALSQYWLQMNSGGRPMRPRCPERQPCRGW